MEEKKRKRSEDDDERESNESDDNEKEDRVFFIYSEDSFKLGDCLPINQGRYNLLFKLLRHYKLLKRLHLVEPSPATKEDLNLFHTKKFVEVLEKYSSNQSDQKEDEEEKENYGEKTI